MGEMPGMLNAESGSVQDSHHLPSINNDVQVSLKQGLKSRNRSSAIKTTIAGKSGAKQAISKSINNR